MRPIQLAGKSHAAFLDFKGRRRTSTFVKSSGKMQYIRSGSQFRRTHSDSLVETARVLAVASDGSGIPHVRFEVVFEKPDGVRPYHDGPRMLALSTFATTYREHVGD